MSLGHQYCERMIKAFKEALTDVDNVEFKVVALGEIFDLPLYVIEAKCPDVTLIFRPQQVDNGASGIKNEILIEVRNACGEDIPYPVVTARTFDDLNTTAGNHERH